MQYNVKQHTGVLRIELTIIKKGIHSKSIGLYQLTQGQTLG